MTEKDSKTILENVNQKLATNPVVVGVEKAATNNKSLIIMVLVVIALLFGAYFVYNMFFGKKDQPNVFMTGGMDADKKRRRK
jgi:flagellar basal body-associated protein FliL